MRSSSRTPERSPSAEDLTAHVRAHLAAFKRPRRVEFVDALPLTSNGKVAKEVLRQTLTAPAAG